MKLKDLKYKTINLTNKKRKRLSSPFLNHFLFFSLSPLLLFSFSPPTAAQSGGAFTIEKSVISSGGGTVSGGTITVENTVGQPSAGLSQNPPFILFGGFITPSLAPTAANVSVSGKVFTETGQGIANAKVTLTDENGESRTVYTSAFGYFEFEAVAAGQTYIFQVRSRRYRFAPQVVNVTEDIQEMNFTAENK